MTPSEAPSRPEGCRWFPHRAPFNLTLRGAAPAGHAVFVALWKVSGASPRVVLTETLRVPASGLFQALFPAILNGSDSYRVDWYDDANGDGRCQDGETVWRAEVPPPAGLDVFLDASGAAAAGACSSFAGPFSLRLMLAGFPLERPAPPTLPELRGFYRLEGQMSYGERPFGTHALDQESFVQEGALSLGRSYEYWFYLDADLTSACGAADPKWSGTLRNVNADVVLELRPRNADGGCPPTHF